MGSEIIEVVERRRRWPVEIRLRILGEVLQRGASIAAVADRNGVSRGLVYQWLRQVREGRMPGLALKPEAAPTFATVRVAAKACDAQALRCRSCNERARAWDVLELGTNHH